MVRSHDSCWRSIPVDLGIEAGLGLRKRDDFCENFREFGAENMDGEERKSGSKRRSKQADVCLDSDDDEPIGSLLKLKRPRNPKKVRKAEVEDDGFGGMDDTLASLRKKLKGLKKGSVAGTKKGKSSSLVTGESSDPDFIGTAEGDSSDVKSVLKMEEKSFLLCNGGSDVAIDVVENGPKGKAKRPTANLNTKRSDAGSESMGSGCSLLKDKKVPSTMVEEHTAGVAYDVHLEDSLSSFFSKVKSGSTKKSLANSGTREDNETSQGRSSSVESLRLNYREHDELSQCRSNTMHDEPIRDFDANVQEGHTTDPCTSGNVWIENSQQNTMFQHSESALKTCMLKDEILRCSSDDPVSTNVAVHAPCRLLNEETLKDSKESSSHLSHGPSQDHVKTSEPPECRNELDSDSSQCCKRFHLPKNEENCAYMEEADHASDPASTHIDQNASPIKAICVQSQDGVSNGDDVAPDENESYPDETLSLPDTVNKEGKLSANRAMRKHKKHRHGDMAYEGDADWESLMDDRSFGSRVRFDPSLGNEIDAEGGGAAAVSSGLKARAVGPVEKIIFKEILKRRGGVHDYLQCRNQILALWNKDVTRILPLSDFGVTESASANELSRASLIRDVFAFLDQRGFINFGIASVKDKTERGSEQNYKLLSEKTFVESSGISVADSEDGVSFITGQFKSSTTLNEAKDEFNINDKDQTHEGEQLPKVEEPRECFVDLTQNGYLGTNFAERVDNLDSKSSGEILDVGKDDSFHILSVSNKEVEKNDDGQFSTDIRKKIIVIGAGPAGLTAARHLARQGFSVAILEARNRVGGRVYTDSSSLSVPVDLGASIITGVEADMDTERRPDPTSLICAQLGLELTILNSDCPLYDTVTAQKVASDLDEALESEFNSLLDDMILLVAQKGEHAMKMSLEEGLEYALETRRKARLGCNLEEKKHFSVMNGSVNIEPNVDLLNPLERRVMDWHFANLEYGCAALLKEVSLPYWNQDDVYGGFGGAHCMIKGGYSKVVETLSEGLCIHLNHVVSDVSYNSNSVKVSTSNGADFLGDAVLITVPLGCLKAETIKFSPPLPHWKQSSVQRLGFGVLNKVVLEFPEVFWDDSVDYFGATTEETDKRGQCFMFWNIKKTVGAPVLIALLVGKAAIDGQNTSSSDHVKHAVAVLRKLFGEESVPDPVGSVVTDWGQDPFSYGAYSYVAVGSSGEDYDVLGRPVEKCLFFAGEATCKEHPDTVGGAMMSGLREAVRIIDILTTGNDYTAEAEAMEDMHRQSESERDEVRDIIRRLDAVELSNVLYKDSLDGTKLLTMEALLKDMFFNAKANAGRLHLVKELLKLRAETLKSFAGTKEGLSNLNLWILDSMGKDGTQLLRHCVRLLVLVSTDLLAVRLSGIGKTVKEKVCVHTSRDIRAIASQLVNVWLEVFRKEKASSVGSKFSRQSASADSSKRKSFKDPVSGKPPLHSNQGALNGKLGSAESDVEAMTEEEKAAFAAAEAAQAAALAAAEAYASSEAKSNTLLQLPKIPSFHKFARREQYVQVDENDLRKKWSGAVSGRQDCASEIDSRNCRVRDWSVDFSATCVNLDNSRVSADSNEMAGHLNLREHSGESAAAESSILTKAWVDAAGSVGIKDYHAIDRWQSQAEAADSHFFDPNEQIRDEEDSNASSRQPTWQYDGRPNESSLSHVTVKKDSVKSHHRGADRIKQAVVDYVASLLMPLYKAKKIDREGYKSIMKKSATKVMEQATDAEKAMAVSQFLDYKRKNKIRAFVDKLIERHMASKPSAKS